MKNHKAEELIREMLCEEKGTFGYKQFCNPEVVKTRHVGRKKIMHVGLRSGGESQSSGSVSSLL